MNYFRLFRLPIHYSIDNKLLALRYKTLQKQFHPDRTISIVRDKEFNKKFIKKSAIINIAYKTLKDSIKRAEYLLSLNGVMIDNECYTINDELILNEQIKLYEELEQIQESCTNKNILLNLFNNKIENMMNILIKKITYELNNEKWKSAKSYIYKIKFLKKLQTQIEIK